MIPRLQQFLAEARAAQVPVIFVAAGYGEAYLSSADRERFLRLHGRVIPVCRPGTWGAEFYEVAPRPGEPVIVPAGSIAVFSSVCFHRSGANRSPRMRRVYLAQYSPEPILNLKGEIADFAEPLLRDGVKVPLASPL